MATARIPVETRVFIQSALGNSTEISAISQTNPGVVTHAGTSPEVGDYVVITDVQGMTDLEDALCRVSAADGTTFTLEDQDTAEYDAFLSGKFRTITLDTEIMTPTGIEITGGEQQFAPYQLLRKRRGASVPASVDEVKINLPMLWDPQDASSAAMKKAASKHQKIGFKLLFPDGLQMLFFGYVGATGLPSTSDMNTVMQTTASITVNSEIRYVFPK